MFLIIFFAGGHNITSLQDQYVTVAKRYGRIAYCLIPSNIYLILRPQSSTSYLNSLNLHKWTSRFIILCSLIHTVGFLVHWKEEKALSHAFYLLNFLGVAAFTFLFILAFVSLYWVRRFNYLFFYLFHNFTSILMIVLITFHARPGVTPTFIITALFLVYFLYLRFWNVYKVDDIKIIEGKNSKLQIIKIPIFFNWSPGSHIRINYSYSFWECWLGPTHPFSIANNQEDNLNQITLIMRKTNFKFDPTFSYLLSKPYVSIEKPFFNNVEIVNIIVGGSGISFGLPIYNHLKNTNTRVKLIWATRSKNDLFINKHLDMKGVEVYTTKIDDDAAPEEVFKIGEDESEGDGLLDDDANDEEIEMESLNNKKAKGDKEEFVLGRPNLDEVFASDIGVDNDGIDGDKCWVLACGPPSLVKDAKNWSKSHGFNFFNEKYEM
ncbi:unnamed protein product [Candida verbasci]|uniref:Probable metalloreductase AIM14 n=1 Tax=Candida verbasci TaxID=1227364 RepID=A0A9W4XK64_9ASCO|nr:unnamed protein product [Candida verbasci]